MIQAYAVQESGGKLSPFEYDPGELGPEDVEIQVEYCGICHSDLSMVNNEWGNAVYPLVPGHEAAGKVAAVGERVTRVKVGDSVGLGWFARSCMTCSPCMDGDHNMCSSRVAEQTIVRRHGAFADKVRCHEAWAVKIPDAVDLAKAGPLFCGGLTVFNPIQQFDIRPTQRVGVVGIGGLGHMALMFLRAWGCHVTAFTSSEAKAEEAKQMGAHDVLNSRDAKALRRAGGSFDFILVTVNVGLDWNAYLNCLKPRGRLHLVGAVLEPMPISVFSLMGGQKSVSSSPLGSPSTAAAMLEFCARHDIAPVTEEFALADVNNAIEHLEAGKARYRIVLKV